MTKRGSLPRWPTQVGLISGNGACLRQCEDRLKVVPDGSRGHLSSPDGSQGSPRHLGAVARGWRGGPWCADRVAPPFLQYGLPEMILGDNGPPWSCAASTRPRTWARTKASSRPQRRSDRSACPGPRTRGHGVPRFWHCCTLRERIAGGHPRFALPGRQPSLPSAYPPSPIPRAPSCRCRAPMVGLSADCTPACF